MPTVPHTQSMLVFHGMTDDEAWEVCMDFEDWVYSNAEAYSAEAWGNAVKQICAYFDSYYRKYR